jgi:hypothetical protein
MSLPEIPTSSPGADRPEQLARLVYELLDAHADTESSWLTALQQACCGECTFTTCETSSGPDARSSLAL